ncbi:MAG: class I SAM-dependent methyltransferase [Pseudomonadota bacterium]
MIRQLAPRPQDRICEIGCGTARNLIRLARHYPTIRLYGIDASAEMLKTADLAIARAGLGTRIEDKALPGRAARREPDLRARGKNSTACCAPIRCR